MTADADADKDITNRNRGSNFRSPAALSRFFLTTVVGLTVDLWTKVWAFRELAVLDADGSVLSSRTVPALPGWLQFQVTQNYGAVFGIGQGQRWLFLLVSALAIAFLTYLFATSGRQWFYQVVLGMLLAGVLGNMYDRVRFGYVRDMIHALPGRHWPAPLARALPPSWDWTRAEVFPWIFNVADSLLCVGVALMILYSLFAAPRPAIGPEGTRARAES